LVALELALGLATAGKNQRPGKRPTGDERQLLLQVDDN
jgi:hypothetical protein